MLREGLVCGMTWAYGSGPIELGPDCMLLVLAAKGRHRPDNIMLQALAVMEERQGNKEAAIALLERALAQDPLDAPSWQASLVIGLLLPT